jgi:hypothetical protein
MKNLWVFISGLIVGILIIVCIGFTNSSTGRYIFSPNGIFVIDTQTGIIKNFEVNRAFAEYEK